MILNPKVTSLPSILRALRTDLTTVVARFNPSFSTDAATGAGRRSVRTSPR